MLICNTCKKEFEAGVILDIIPTGEPLCEGCYHDRKLIEGMTIYKSRYILIEKDSIMDPRKLPWFSLGIHLDWQHRHIIFYLGHVIITIGNTIWGISPHAN